MVKDSATFNVGGGLLSRIATAEIASSRKNEGHSANED